VIAGEINSLAAWPRPPLLQQREARDHVLVEHTHLRRETGPLFCHLRPYGGKLSAHLCPNGRKFNPHLSPELGNLRREVVDPGRKLFESGHARLE
jgi:hypothetical protein